MKPIDRLVSTKAFSLSRRSVVQAALLAGAGFAFGCRTLRSGPINVSTVEMYATFGDWIDQILTSNPDAAGFDALISWMRREFPPDLTDEQADLLFAELFLEGERAAISGAADLNVVRDDYPTVVPEVRMPISREQTESLLLARLDIDRLPSGFFKERVARAEEATQNDPALAARYKAISEVQNSPLFRKKNGGRCGGWFCRVWKTVVVVAVLVIAVVLCAGLEECREKVGG